MINRLKKDKVKGKIIKTKELVEYFGNDKQKKTYYRNKKINKNAKEAIIKVAKSYCDIEDLGRGKYLIKEVYNSKRVQYSRGDLSTYIIPISLYKLIELDETKSTQNGELVRHISMNNMEYAEEFGWINKKRYNHIKYNIKEFCKTRDYDEDIVKDFMISFESMISYNIDKSFDKLSTIKSKGGYGICKREDEYILVKQGNIGKLVKQGKVKGKELGLINIEKTYNNPYKCNKEYHSRGTYDEVDMIFRLQEESKLETVERIKEENEDNKYIIKVPDKNIDKDFWFGYSKKVYDEILNDKYNKKGINYTYKNNLLRYKSLDNCKQVLKEVNLGYSREKLEDLLFAQFYKNLLRSGERKYEQHPKKLERYNNMLSELELSLETNNIEKEEYRKKKKQTQKTLYNLETYKTHRNDKEFVKQYNGTVDYSMEDGKKKS